MKLISKCLFFILPLILASCGLSPTAQVAGENQSPQISEPQIGTPYSEIAIQEIRTSNCDGANPTTTISRSLIQEQTTYFEVAVEAGSLVRGSAIPTALEGEVEAKIKAALGSSYGNKSEQTISTILTTQPNQALKHKILWNETKVKGLIDVVYPSGTATINFEKVIGIELFDRTSEPISCDESGENILPTTPLEITPVLPQQEQPTSAPHSGLRWEQEVAGVPNGTTIKWDLTSGQILFLSGGQMRINGEYCGGDANQICILLFQSTNPQTVVVDALIPNNNWYGISSILTQDEALSEKEPQFWYPPNCINGCKKATVLYFTDGQLVNKTTLTP